MNKKKIGIIISLFVFILILIIVIIILNVFDAKVQKEDNNVNIDTEEIDQTNITWNKMDNAEIVDGEKVCTSKYLDEEHKIWYYMANVESDLTSNNLKIYTDKDKDLIKASIPITNNGDKIYNDTIVDLIFYNKRNNQIFEGAYTIEEIKPKETYVLEISVDRDITNTYDYQIWIED